MKNIIAQRQTGDDKGRDKAVKRRSSIRRIRSDSLTDRSA
jgi:hypothetical protein